MVSSSSFKRLDGVILGAVRVISSLSQVCCLLRHWQRRRLPLLHLDRWIVIEMNCRSTSDSLRSHLDFRTNATGVAWLIRSIIRPGYTTVNFLKQMSWAVLGGIIGGISGVLATFALTDLCVLLNPEDKSAGSVGIIIILFLPGGIIIGAIVGAILSKRKRKK